MSADHVGALVLMIVAVLLALWGLAKELRERRRRQIQAARRRHPSGRVAGSETLARPTMSERERRYHGSDQWGR